MLKKAKKGFKGQKTKNKKENNFFINCPNTYNVLSHFYNVKKASSILYQIIIELFLWWIACCCLEINKINSSELKKTNLFCLVR
jgi:hypothetical protein